MTGDSEADAGRYGPLDEDDTYTLAAARADARRWGDVVAMNGATRGWRVCCAMLEERVGTLESALRDLLPYAETCCPNPINVGEENVIAKAKRLLGETA